jgi:cyclopropane fatty-acyl-phospholipid synthase-like methyltransferase
MLSIRSLALLSALLSACSAPTSVQTVDLATEASVKPGINENFLREGAVEQYTQRFETESREIFSRRKEIVAALGLEPGMEVADIGAGTGLFLGPFAEAVGSDGHVHLVDISPGFVSLIENRIRRLGLEHASVQLCTDRSVELPPQSVDLVFICDVYHHFEYPRNTLASIHEALRPGGQVVVIDFHRIDGVTSEWTMNHVRAGEEVFTAEIEAAGFERLEQRHDLLEANYFLRFVRKDA